VPAIIFSEIEGAVQRHARHTTLVANRRSARNTQAGRMRDPKAGAVRDRRQLRATRRTSRDDSQNAANALGYLRECAARLSWRRNPDVIVQRAATGSSKSFQRLRRAPIFQQLLCGFQQPRAIGNNPSAVAQHQRTLKHNVPNGSCDLVVVTDDLTGS